jgi:hypothetical protein
MCGISCSVSPGITGATMTPTGMPAFASVSTACRRRFGVEARGSSTARQLGVERGDREMGRAGPELRQLRE